MRQAIFNTKQPKIDTEQLAKRINMVYVLPDLIEQYSLEIKQMLQNAGEFRHEDKQHLNQIISLCRKWVRNVDRILGQNGQFLYGESADELKKLIDEKTQIKNN